MENKALLNDPRDGLLALGSLPGIKRRFRNWIGKADKELRQGAAQVDDLYSLSFLLVQSGNKQILVGKSQNIKLG